ncbi:MAG: hypothetical protein D6805_10400 [Planctomycetota bacterium]|nr:MAG: hypothetical protein D6805_10400 [Planctomycetota bacterium]
MVYERMIYLGFEVKMELFVRKGKKMKKWLVCFVLMPYLVWGGGKEVKRPRIDPKFKKLKNPLPQAKKGEWVKYRVLLTLAAMGGEPMKSALLVKVVRVSKKYVDLYFQTNVFGQVRKEVRRFPKNVSLLDAVLQVIRYQFRTQGKLIKATLKKEKVKIGKKELKLDVAEVDFGAAVASGHKGTLKGKFYFYKEVPILHLYRVLAQSKWKMGDAILDVKVQILFQDSSRRRKKKS